MRPGMRWPRRPLPRRLPSRAWFENGYGIEWMQIGVSMQALDSVSGFLKKVVPKPIQELAEFIRFAFITVVNTVLLFAVYVVRSEERRVGKEGRSRWSP